MRVMLLFFVFIFYTNFSYAVEFKGEFQQGSFILGKTEPGSQVTIDKKKVRVSKDGYFAFGLGRDRKNDVVIKIMNNQKLKVFEKRILNELNRFDYGQKI